MNTVIAFVRLSELAKADFDRTLACLDESARERILSFASERGRKESLAARACLFLADKIFRERFFVGRPVKNDAFSFLKEEENLLIAEWNAGARFLFDGQIPCFLPGSFTRLQSGLYANLSHTDGVAMAAVADCPVGADVQTVRAVSVAVKNRVCTEAERAEIAASKNPDRTFAGLWTKKESYVKSLGQGIASGLAALDFAASAPQITAVRFVSGEFCGAPYAVCLREKE